MMAEPVTGTGAPWMLGLLAGASRLLALLGAYFKLFTEPNLLPLLEM